MLEHPTLLLGSAQSNPDNVWPRVFDGMNDFAILLRRQLTRRGKQIQERLLTKHQIASNSLEKRSAPPVQFMILAK
jgi:hypothetical protein